MSNDASLPPLLAAARGVRPSRRPVWFMRQAGRSLPEYRAARGDGSILGAIGQADLAAEITLQPVRRYGVDGAVMFSDIVVPAAAIGFGIDVAPGTGPVAADPVRAAADLQRLRPYEPDVDAPYIAESVRIVRGELPADVAVLAFAGAPFTVASYLVEGRPSRTYEHTKALIHTDEALWHDLMERLTDQAVVSITAQLEAGADAFQLFDSWAGALAVADYERFVLPHSQRVFTAIRDAFPDAPGIHYGVGCDHLLESMAAAGPTVIGLDWRTPIASARQRLGADQAVQGNLDPALVLAGTEVALAGVDAVLADNGGHPAHIFNLGHGVQPNTDPAVLEAVTARVHEAPPMTTGVVVMAYGTPASRDEIRGYYSDIRRGRPPTDEQLAQLVARYDVIATDGDLSPLTGITRAQAAALQRSLDVIEPGAFVVEVGMKHAAPRIEDAVAALAGRGVDRLVGLVMAPHYSALSIGDYIERMRSAAGDIPATAVTTWATEPAYVDFLADQIGGLLPTMPPNTKVLFTAHSLPERVLAMGDPYPDELRATAAAVGARLGLGPWAAWSVAWQSAGRTPEPWLGPDVLAVIDSLAASENASGVIVCPCGFVADHLEVLYDLDIEARARAAGHGLVFARTGSLNADAEVFAALAARVAAA